MKMFSMMKVWIVCATLLAFAVQGARAATVSGELKKWHKVSIDFNGPKTSEQATPNPFTDYRLNVTFKQGDSSYVVPGYFAADGNAENSSADSGSIWRVHFSPDAVGEWAYVVSFRSGENVAVSEAPYAGKSGGFMDGKTGTFRIAPTDKTGRDHRAKGRLQVVGKHHLRFAETGEYFLKCGADAPENFLSYRDFDGDFKADGEKDTLVKSWAPHLKDWRSGNPTWKDGRGKGMIGAVNYLASEGMNAFSFLTMNIEGDDRNAFPYTHYKERLRMDVSRLAQWEVVFEHGDHLGMFLHFKTQETENECLLDGGDTGLERKLYYRELIARFSHHLALNWNLGEENGKWGKGHGKKQFQSTAQRKAMAQYFYEHDPYRHLVVIHNGQQFDDLVGKDSALTGLSVQTSNPEFVQVHGALLRWIKASAAAGKPWVVSIDEPGDASHSLLPDAEDPTHHFARKNALWGGIMAGGAGIEWYFGYKHAHSDLTCQDYRSRDLMWDQCRIALQFFEAYDVPFWNMTNRDEWSSSDDWVLAGEEHVVVYLPKGGKAQITLPAGTYSYGWVNPRSGEGLKALFDSGLVKADGVQVFDAPDQQDWVLLLKRGAKVPVSARAGRATEMTLDAMNVFGLDAVKGFAPPYFDKARNVFAIDAAIHKDTFAAVQTKFKGASGIYDIKIVTLTETDGESTYRLAVNGIEVGSFTNPPTTKDYVDASQVWSSIQLKTGDSLRVAFNSASNGKIPEGDGFAFSRGRFSKLLIGEPGSLFGWVAHPERAAPPKTVKAASKGNASFVFNFDPETAATVFEEVDGEVAFEAEHFAGQGLDAMRKWYKTSADHTPNVQPDPDPNHAAGASGGTYLEILPDTRKNHSQKLIAGENFSNQPGKLGVLYYPVYFNNPGRYHVWVRICCTGSEDNGLHVGLDGKWPESGQRMQWIGKHGEWQWDSKQRTEKVHTGVRHQIWLDVEKAGLHTVMLSMREDGTEIDKIWLTRKPKMPVPSGTGPKERVRAR